jgi:hypothetical protein
MKNFSIGTSILTAACILWGCTLMPKPPPVWGHTSHVAGQPPATWTLYKNEELLSGRHDFTLCGTSDAPESKDARFCFRRVADQLIIYIALPHEKLRTARAGILTYVRVDSKRPVSPRTARTARWGRGFNPRMPGLSFPVDGTNPRMGVVEPGGLYSQLLEGETLSALVPLEPDRFGEYTIHVDGLAPLLRELWEHER